MLLLAIIFVIATVVISIAFQNNRLTAAVYVTGFGLLTTIWLGRSLSYNGFCDYGGTPSMYFSLGRVPCTFLTYLNFSGMPIIGILSIPLIILLIRKIRR